MAYIVPQAQVYQEFNATSVANANPLQAFIVGPNYQTIRYAQASEKQLGSLGAYNADLATNYAWPNLQVGAVVIQGLTQLFIDNALLRYYYVDAGSSNTTSTFAADGYKNRIHSTSINWVTYSSFARNVGLGNRDVTVGDTVTVSAVVSGNPVSLTTYVAGFINDMTASSKSSSADSTNAVGTDAGTATQTSGTSNNVAVGTVSVAAYDGLADGNVNEVYTVTVTTGSIGGDATTAVLKVVSASGNDSVSTVIPAAFGSATAIGTRGLEVTWTTSASNNFVAGQVWRIVVSQNYAAAVATVTGTYTGATNTTYVVTVSAGGLYAANPTITVSTTTGIDVGGPYAITASATPVAIGSYGLSVAFSSTGLSLGDRFYIVCTAPAKAAVKTIVLGKNLPAALITGAPALSVTLGIQKNIQVSENRLDVPGQENFVSTLEYVTVNAGITSADSTWVDDTGNLIPLPVISGDVFVQYKAFSQVGTDAPYTASTEADIITYLGGAIDADHELQTGIAKALANSNGVPVYFMATADDTLASYEVALEAVTDNTNIYAIVPMTFDRAIQDECAAHVQTMSTPENGRWRITWVSTQGLSEIPVSQTHPTSGDALLATIVVDPNAPTTQYTIVDLVTTGEVTPLSFVTAGVKVGDVVRAQYTLDDYSNPVFSEYVVAQVISDDSLRLVAGPSVPVSVAAKIEIWRVLNSTGIANYVGSKAAAFASRRVYNVWPDQAVSAGVTYPGYILAAALAGLKSGVVPQQGLTNVAVAGFDAVPRSTRLMSVSDLNTMAGDGVYIVTQNPAGTIYTRHQLSTDNSDLNMQELSVTTNVDSISYLLLETVAPFIGKYNTTPATSELVSVAIGHLATSLSASVGTAGPQVLDMALTSLAASPILADRLVAVVTADLPYPLNIIEVHLVV